MLSSLLIVIIVLVGYWVVSLITGLRANIVAAKRSGLKYFIVPAQPFNILWQVTHKLWIPLIKGLLPKTWWENWLEVLMPDSAWKLGHVYFENIGAETVLLVSPGAMLLLTDNAEAIQQITQRRENFPKRLDDYKILEIFGRNVVTTEGNLWRMHRKVTSASFNEKNTALVWKETICQTQSLVYHWMDYDMGRDSTRDLDKLDHDIMRAALHIITYVGFGLNLLWPGEETPEDMDTELARFSSRDAPPGHSMSFVDSLEKTMEKLFLKLLVPGFLVKNLPFQATKVTYEATDNFSRYLKELLEYKQRMIQGGIKGEPGMDVMGQLVHTQYGSGDGKKWGIQLTDSEIMGNAFVVLLAGHETTANTLHFALLELAKLPTAQRAMQRDIDAMLGSDSNPQEWNYESSIGPLLESAVGASMNEILRVIPPVIQVPKMVSSDQDQPITIDGNKYSLPRGASISLVTAAVQRNPRYWPNGSKDAQESDLDKFNPERWIQKSEGGSNDENSSVTPAGGGKKGLNLGPTLFRPVRGSYIPFSDGARSCLGKRISVVEVVAALAVIFQTYSVELAVEEWASNEEVSRMSKDERKKLYLKAQKLCDEKISRAYSLITLKVHRETVPIRLVKRGKERFINDL